MMIDSLSLHPSQSRFVVAMDHVKNLAVKLLNYVLKTLDQTETIIKNLYYEH